VEAGDVSGGVDATLGDLNDACRYAFHEVQRCVEGDLEGVQVAVVDADEIASGGECPFELGVVVDFDERVELVLSGLVFEGDELVLFQGGDDEEDGVGAAGAGFEELELIEDKVFA
jgi:hypothetical protein